MIRRIRGYLSALLLLTPAILQAQNAVITGTVRNPTLAPVRGASISIPTLNVGTVTNDAGAYRLVVPAAQVRGQTVAVEVASIGFRTSAVDVQLSPGTIRTDVTLVEQAIALDEIVVTGTAGRLERKAQSANISKIDAANVARTAPAKTVGQLLQARVAGVSVQEASGSSGTAQTIRMRGQASISLSNEPLVFIDGVRADSRTRQIYGVGGQSASRLNDIPPEDIESIEIVKGPAAATLYGADASAGVIQIFTKRGRPGGGFQQTIGVEYHSLDQDWSPPHNWAVCSAADVANASRTLCFGQPVNTIISDHPFERAGGVFRRGELRGLSWSGRGGGQNFGYYISMNADKEDGTLPNNEYDSWGGTFNFDWLPNRTLTLQAGLGLNKVRTDLPRNDNDIYGYLGGHLIGSPRTVGLPQNGWFGANRALSAIAAYRNENETLRLRPRASANWSPVTWFTNRFTVGADVVRSEAASFFPKNDSSWYGTAELNSGSIGEARENADRVTLEYLGNVTVARVLPDLRADISFGSQYTDIRADLTDITGVGLITNTARSVDRAARITGGGQEYERTRTIGFFGQTQFGFKDRLFLQVAARLDMHSAFGEDADPFLSPKVGVSYVLTDEPAVRNAIPSFVNSLRLRASYGTTGRAPGVTDELTTFDAASLVAATQILPGVTPGAPGDRSIQPERGKEFETGADVGLFNERLGLELTYFHKRAEDLILDVPLPPSAGFSAASQEHNIGAMKNLGFEVAANAQLLTMRNLGWSVRLAMNTLDNKVLDLADVAAFGQLNRVTEGRPTHSFHSRKIRSIDTVAVRAIVSDTVEFVGNLLPSFEGSASTVISLFGYLDLYGQVDWKQDFYIFNSTDEFRERQTGTGERWIRRNELLSAEERIRRFGPFFRESDGAGIAAGNVNIAYIEPADFVRLREVSLTASVPADLARRVLRASGASVTVGARNLKLWTDYSGADPEVNTNTSGTSRQEFLTIPAPRRYIFRMNLQY